MDGDIAVLEHRIGDDWEVVVYIGKDRGGGVLSEYYDDSDNYNSCDLRIRYLDEN